MRIGKGRIASDLIAVEIEVTGATMQIGNRIGIVERAADANVGIEFDIGAEGAAGQGIVEADGVSVGAEASPRLPLP